MSGPGAVLLTADLQESCTPGRRRRPRSTISRARSAPRGRDPGSGPAVRDGLILEMPPAPLCDLDCPGLCVHSAARSLPTTPITITTRPTSLGGLVGTSRTTCSASRRKHPGENKVGVPKRKKSRSNTRPAARSGRPARRSLTTQRWHAVRPSHVACPDQAPTPSGASSTSEPGPYWCLPIL